MVELRPHQEKALCKIENGSILNGGVGSGKSITGIAYYFTKQGGTLGKNGKTMVNPKDLYIITTARKRDESDWELELARFHMSTNPEANYYKNKVVVDSWNNIKKYADISDAFFLFDEQRVVGWGAWSKTFIKIAHSNEWILLSATPGDTWSDYIPVFIANGFYRNKTEFNREHIVFSRFAKYPKVDKYINIGRLIRLRNKILVDMDFERTTVRHNIDILVNYNHIEYKDLMKNRFNWETNEPVKNAAELCYLVRKIINSDLSRVNAVFDIVQEKRKVIIFYNFDYELDILKNQVYMTKDGKVCEIAEWNGHKHQPIPDSDAWVYLVQYTAGAEGWNCIKTDTVIFYSQNYSYKIMEQSSGRIDRLNTPYIDLYFYHLKSKAGLDIAINKAIKTKKKFNEQKFLNFN